MDVEDVIPLRLFDEYKPFILTDILFCEKNENKSKGFIKIFYHFKNAIYSISINWITKKVKSLFPLKDKNIHPPCKIYHGLCLVRRTVVVNHNVIWQLHGENITILPIILSLQNI